MQSVWLIQWLLCICSLLTEYFQRKNSVVYLLVPVGESHHDVQRSQTEVEVEKGVAVSDSILLIVHGSAYAILSHHTLFNRPFILLRLHQPVYLGVSGRTDTREGTDRTSFTKLKQYNINIKYFL